jgi:hypothetical protein
MDCDLLGSIDRCGDRGSQLIPDDPMRSMKSVTRLLDCSIPDNSISRLPDHPIYIADRHRSIARSRDREMYRAYHRR